MDKENFNGNITIATMGGFMFKKIKKILRWEPASWKGEVKKHLQKIERESVELKMEYRHLLQRYNESVEARDAISIKRIFMKTTLESRERELVKAERQRDAFRAKHAISRDLATDRLRDFNSVETELSKCESLRYQTEMELRRTVDKKDEAEYALAQIEKHEKGLARLSKATPKKGVCKVEIYWSSGKGYSWKMIAPNGNNVANGRSYASKQGCFKGVARARKAFLTVEEFFEENRK